MSPRRPSQPTFLLYIRPSVIYCTAVICLGRFTHFQNDLAGHFQTPEPHMPFDIHELLVLTALRCGSTIKVTGWRSKTGPKRAVLQGSDECEMKRLKLIRGSRICPRWLFSKQNKSKCLPHVMSFQMKTWRKKQFEIESGIVVRRPPLKIFYLSIQAWAHVFWSCGEERIITQQVKVVLMCKVPQSQFIIMFNRDDILLQHSYT